MNSSTSSCFLALDLEFNQPSQRIIQVGVALGSPGQSLPEFVVRQWILDPQESVAPDIEALTGISDALVQQCAVPVAAVAQELGELIGTHRPFVNPVTWGGGDVAALKELFAQSGVYFPYFGRRWLDVKTMHTLIAMAQGKSASGGLGSVMARYKAPFVGAAHRADADAANTLRLFFKLLARQSALENAAKTLTGV